MTDTFAQGRVEVLSADITALAVDAIVNAANPSLLGGGGVDGAIHRAAGPALLAACRPLGPIKAGEVRMTPGFDLPARFVIHAVGPVWQDGKHDEDALLASCYRAALELAAFHAFDSIAFPAISTGAFGFPAERAARVSCHATRLFLRTYGRPGRIVLCGFSDESTAILARIAREVFG